MKTKTIRKVTSILLSICMFVTMFTCLTAVSGVIGAFNVSASSTYDTVPAMTTVTPKFEIFNGAAFQGTFGSGGVSGQGHLPGYSSGSPAQKTFAAGSVADYGRFEFDFYLDDASIITARNVKLYLNLRVDTSGSGSRATYEFQDQITEDGWNHIIVDAGLADNILAALTITKFYIDIDADSTGASDRYKVANICATKEAYSVMPAMPDVSPRFDIQTGSAFSGTWGSDAVTGQGHLPGYKPAAKTFTNPGLSDYGCFEFDLFLDDVSIITTRNLKLYFNVRRSNDSSITTFEYQDQITSSGWNHIKITTGMTDANLNDIGRIRFYVDIDAGSTGAADRYKVANICATPEAYKLVPAMPNISPRFDIYEGSAFSGTWGSNAITGQGHMNGFSPSEKVFDNPGLSSYDYFEFDVYIDDLANFTARATKLYLNVRDNNYTSKELVEYTAQIASDGWNHIKIPFTLSDSVLDSLHVIRFYMDIDAGDTGATDRYRIANICATVDLSNIAPAMPTGTVRFDIFEGIEYSGVWGSSAITGQGHMHGYSPSEKVFDNPGLSSYDYFEFDVYIDDLANFTARATKLYLNVRDNNYTSKELVEYTEQIMSDGWNHVKILFTLSDSVLDTLHVIRFYMDINAGETGATDRYRIANLCATVSSSEPAVTNLLSGLAPYTYITVNDGTTTFSWTDMYVDGTSNQHKGYDTGTTDAQTRTGDIAGPNVEYWASRVATMTDGDNSTGCYTASVNTSKDILIAYEIPTANITGFFINGISNSNNVDFYASNSMNTLFSNQVINVTPQNELIDADVSEAGVTYIGFRINGAGRSEITEIAVYGTAMTDLVAGKSPVALYPLYDNTLNYSFHYLTVINDSNYYRYGYCGEPASPPLSGSGLVNPEDCAADLAQITDADSNTYSYIKNNQSNEDIAIVYSMNNTSKISEIFINSLDNIPGIEIYLSNSFVSLFKTKSLVYSDTDGDNSLLFEPEFTREALYMGIVFRIDGTSRIRLKNISVIGETIATFDDSRISGKIGVSGGPANTNANRVTKAFYQYLKNVGASDKVLLGAHIRNTAERLDKLTAENNYYSYLEYQLGYSPVIYSTTFSNDGSHVLSIDQYKQYYDQGAVPLLSCVFASKLQVFQDLLDSGDGDAINYMVKYLDKTYTPSNSEKSVANTAYDEFWNTLVPSVGDFLEDLEDAGVETYIVSMFNEMNMYGFYGNKNHTEIIDRFINVWRQVYDYLINERKLKGALFALRPTGSHAAGTYRANPYLYYPGDDYVDIIAPTIYSSDDSGTLDTFDGYTDFVGTGKIMALSEIGPLSSYDVDATADCLNMLNSLKTTYSDVAFASLWFGYRFNILRHDNYQEFIEDESIITVEKMFDYRHSSPTGVKFYSGSDFSGTVVGVAVGSYNKSAYSSVVISSLKIDPQYKVTFYANANCTGASRVYGRDVDALSFVYNSYKVEYTGHYNVYDVNSDFCISIHDLVSSKKVLSNYPGAKGNALAADLDNSGTFDGFDVVALRNYLLYN